LLLARAAKERRRDDDDDDDGLLQQWAAEALKLNDAAGFLAPNLGPAPAMEEEAG